MGENIVKNKSFEFAIRIINLYKFLISEKKEYILSKQLLRCGTSVDAMIREAEHAESSADFKHKMSIAQKEIIIDLNYTCKYQDTKLTINN